MKLRKILLSMVCILSLMACNGSKEDVNCNISSTEEDDKRYNAFFKKEFGDMASDLWISLHKPGFLYTYTDLDNDGSDELIIGDEEGIYFVITEIDGKYNKSGSYGWQNQYGPLPSMYVGNGYFITYYRGSRGMATELTHYDSEIKNMVISAKLEEGDDGWDLYVLSKGGTPNVIKINEYNSDYDEVNYTHSFLDYDDAADYDYCELKYFGYSHYHGDGYGCIEKNELGRKYIDLVASKESEDCLEDLTWRPVGEILFKNSKIYTLKDVSSEMARFLSNVTTCLYIDINEDFIDYDSEKDMLIELIAHVAKNRENGYNGKIFNDRVIAADGSSMSCAEFDELVMGALDSVLTR